MNYKLANFLEYSERDVVDITGVECDNGKIRIEADLLLRTPTKLDFFLAYVTLTIPAAMLARVTRKITGRKGTPLEKYLMDYYFDMSVKLLRKE